MLGTKNKPPHAHQKPHKHINQIIWSKRHTRQDEKHEECQKQQLLQWQTVATVTATAAKGGKERDNE